MAAFLLFGLLLTLSLDFTASEIGVTYGRGGYNRLPPQQVVELYKRHNIRRMRTYDPDYAILDALRGSGIELNIVITNKFIEALATDANAANDWVRDHVSRFPDVDIRSISVGNEVSPIDSATAGYSRFVPPGMGNVFRALYRAGRAGRVKVTTTISMSVLARAHPPEAGAFRDDVAPFLRPILSFLANNDAPLMANIYPYFAYVANNDSINVGYALLEPGHGLRINGVYYHNLFYHMLDAVYAAVDRMVGARNHTVGPGRGRARRRIKVVAGETGYPSNGGDAATMRNAQTYNQNLIGVVNNGTPRHREPIEAYIFALFDENEKSGAETERNFGLFHPNGEPKYDLDFN